jgi:hypothetical protein
MKKIIYLALTASLISAATFAQSAGLMKVVLKDKSSQQFSTESIGSLMYTSEGGKDYLILSGSDGQEMARFEIYHPTAGIDTILYQIYESQNSYGIDVDLTLQYGGLRYDGNGPNYGKHAIFLYAQGIKIFHVEQKTWDKYPWTSIPSNWKDLSGGKSFKIYLSSNNMGVVYRDINAYLGETWKVTWFSDGNSTWYDPQMWPLNGLVSSPIIPANVVSQPDGSITLTGSGVEVTAKEW